jgi:hypothetical protein
MGKYVKYVKFQNAEIWENNAEIWKKSKKRGDMGKYVKFQKKLLLYGKTNTKLGFCVRFCHKPVLESADENVNYSEKERHIGFKKKTVFKIGLP